MTGLTTIMENSILTLVYFCSFAPWSSAELELKQMKLPNFPLFLHNGESLSGKIFFSEILSQLKTVSESYRPLALGTL